MPPKHDPRVDIRLLQQLTTWLLTVTVNRDEQVIDDLTRHMIDAHIAVPGHTSGELDIRRVINTAYKAESQVRVLQRNKENMAR